MDLVFAPSRIETWPLDRLRPYARNAKIHSADQVARIAASMAQFGWTVPCMVADDGELIAGHGRVLAANMLGLKNVPVIRLSHLDAAERRAYRIADNKSTELGGWNEALLLEELRDLMAADFDLGLIGVPEDELDALLADADDHPVISGDAADAIPDPPAKPITRPGDIWVLGQHRLCCGDATDTAAVAKLMQGERPKLLFTSPLYAQQRDYGAAREKLGDWQGRLAPSHEFIFHFNRAPRKPHKTVPSKHTGKTLGGGGLHGADGTVHARTGTGNAIQSHRIPDSIFRIMRHKGGLGAAGSHPAVFPVALVERRC